MTATFSPKTAKVTIDDFNALPEGPPYYEFDEGELIQVPSPTIIHADVVDSLVSILKPHARRHDLGRVFREIDVYLPDGRVYVPDIGFLSTDKLGMVSPVDGKVHGAPTLVVEVTSSDENRDRGRKFHVYHANGIEWLWLVSQALLIEEYQATERGYVRLATVEPGEVFNPHLFPGLEIDLSGLLGESNAADGAAQSNPAS